jgi:hypothetical protein
MSGCGGLDELLTFGSGVGIIFILLCVRTIKLFLSSYWGIGMAINMYVVY